ncbi:MATE family efflux transporter, partial [Candidatus Omnitrophota bacterium]
MSKARTIGRNISFMGLKQVVVIIISFFLFPFIVKHVGKEVYGVYLIVMTITGYFWLLDLGVMSALTKYVSEYHGKKDLGGLNKIINASFSFYVLIGIIIAVMLFACSVYFHRFFKIEASNIRIVKQLFMVASISALFVWPLNTFRGTIQGLSLWDKDAIIIIINQALTVLAALFLFSFGYGIVHFFITTQFLMILGCFISYYIAKNKVNFKITF